MMCQGIPGIVKRARRGIGERSVIFVFGNSMLPGAGDVLHGLWCCPRHCTDASERLIYEPNVKTVVCPRFTPAIYPDLRALTRFSLPVPIYPASNGSRFSCYRCQTMAKTVHLVQVESRSSCATRRSYSDSPPSKQQCDPCRRLPSGTNIGSFFALGRLDGHSPGNSLVPSTPDTSLRDCYMLAAASFEESCDVLRRRSHKSLCSAQHTR